MFWTSAIQRQPQYGLIQNLVLVTLTSGWPRNSVAGVEKRRLECRHLLSCLLASGASILDVGAEEEDR